MPVTGRKKHDAASHQALTQELDTAHQVQTQGVHTLDDIENRIRQYYRSDAAGPAFAEAVSAGRSTLNTLKNMIATFNTNLDQFGRTATATDDDNAQRAREAAAQMATSPSWT